MICGSFYGSSHSVTVIFYDKYHRKIPKHGHVKGFMKRTLSRCAITKIGHSHATSFKIFISKSQTGSNGNLSTHDSVSAIKPMFFRENMHRPSHSFRCSGCFSQKFCHDTSWINAHSYWLHVISVCGNHFVFCQVHSVQCTGQNGFLTVV